MSLKSHACLGLDGGVNVLQTSLVIFVFVQGFFRRMAKEREAEKYQCNKSGDCEINMITRNLCKACRYRACIKAGMCVEGRWGENVLLLLIKMN